MSALCPGSTMPRQHSVLSALYPVSTVANRDLSACVLSSLWPVSTVACQHCIMLALCPGSIDGLSVIINVHSRIDCCPHIKTIYPNYLVMFVPWLPVTSTSPLPPPPRKTSPSNATHHVTILSVSEQCLRKKKKKDEKRKPFYPGQLSVWSTNYVFCCLPYEYRICVCVYAYDYGFQYQLLLSLKD